MNGEFLELRKADGFAYPRIIGTVDDFLKEREFQKILAEIRKNAVDVEVEVAKAVSKTLPLRSEKVEVKKTVQTKRNADDIIHLALQGKSGAVLRRLLTIANT
jgi:hypothetical protein